VLHVELSFLKLLLVGTTKNGTLSARDKVPLVTGEPNDQGPISPDAGLGATNWVRRE
jgi:hypothetical protein